jgi:hypothetical protein
MKKMNLVLSVFLGISAGSAFAQGPGIVTCYTSSNGANFSTTERDAGLARNLTSSACVSDSRTNNSECSANLYCSDLGYVPRTITCQTTSNGADFSHQSLSVDLARSLALTSCTSDSRTNNSECSANAWCDDMSPVAPPMITCSTFSNGVNFAHSGRDASLAQSLATSACTADSRTNNSECAANIACQTQYGQPATGGYPQPYPQPQPQPYPQPAPGPVYGTPVGHGGYPQPSYPQPAPGPVYGTPVGHGGYPQPGYPQPQPSYPQPAPGPVYGTPVYQGGVPATPSAPGVISCVTDSNGVRFTHQGRDGSLTRNLTTNSCTADSRTNNSECAANLFCSDQGQFAVSYSCNTFSNNLPFTHVSLDQSLARSRATSACDSDSRTRNSECEANIYCTATSVVVQF